MSATHTSERPVWAQIDVGAIRDNVAAIRLKLRPGCRYMAVVKANAYGHGDVIAAQAALAGGAEWLGVILVSEGRRLRDAGIDAPILLLHEPPAAQADQVVSLGLTPAVFTLGGLEALSDAAERAGRTIPVHVKLETGLNRLGVVPGALDEFATALSKHPRLEVEGVCSHYAIADPTDPSVKFQTERFLQGIERLAGFGVTPAIRHHGNSATALAHPDGHMDMVRVGISTYGIAPLPSMADVVPLRPALSLHARVAMAKRIDPGEGVSYGLHYRPSQATNIATLPLGYADGWPRHATGRTFALIGGRRHPVVGTICMDSFMVDCGNLECDIGDEAVLIGAQGNERITADDVAEALGTIPYEVLTALTGRIERIPAGG